MTSPSGLVAEEVREVISGFARAPSTPIGLSL